MEGENFIYSALDGWHREKLEANKFSHVEILPSNADLPTLNGHVSDVGTSNMPKSIQVSKRGTTNSTTPLLQ